MFNLQLMLWAFLIGFCSPELPGSVSLSASCDSNSIHYYPSGNEIAPNSLIFILADGKMSAGKLRKLVEDKDGFSLQSGNQHIGLLIEQYHQGYQMTEVLLRPTKLLTAGNLYVLKVNTPKGQAADLPLSDQQQNVRQWKVSLQEDHQMPVIKNTSLPKVLSNQPGEQNVSLNLQARDDHPDLLAEVTIKPKGFVVRRKRSKRLLIPVLNDNIALGYNSCSGNYHFQDRKNYQLHFSIMDICGNRTELKGWVPFEVEE